MESDTVDESSLGNRRAPSQNLVVHLGTTKVEVGMGSSGLSFVRDSPLRQQALQLLTSSVVASQGVLQPSLHFFPRVSARRDSPEAS